MSAPSTFPKELAPACRRLGILPTHFIFAVNIAEQTVSVFERSVPQSEKEDFPDYTLFKKYRCSTSRFGIGEIAGSNMTPRGLHRIAEKIGDGCPVGTVRSRLFRARKHLANKLRDYDVAERRGR